MTSPNTLTYPNAVADMAGRAHQAVDDVADKAAPAVDRASAAAHRTIDRVAGTATPAADWMAESAHKVVTRSTELADSCGAQVRARPFASVLGAVALGYLFGRLWR